MMLPQALLLGGLLAGPALASGFNTFDTANNLYGRDASANPPIPYPKIPLASSIPQTPVHFPELGAKRVKMLYGPYEAPSHADHNSSGMGSYSNIMPLPCHDCYITLYEVGLEYPDGTYANTNTSMYLHHGLVVNANRHDPICTNLPYPAQLGFAAGNERIPIDFTVNGTHKAGYYIAPDDTFLFFVQLMNMVDYPRQGIVTVTWEYIPASPDVSIKPITPIWLDIDGPCGGFINGSEVPYPQTGGAVTFHMPHQWSPYTITNTTDRTYEVLQIVSHLHDGGIVLDVAKNGKTVCDGVAGYGESPGYVSTELEKDGKNMTYISSIKKCYNVGTTNASDLWNVTAHYNMTAHTGMTSDDGMLMPIMGIAVLFLVDVTEGC